MPGKLCSRIIIILLLTVGLSVTSQARQVTDMAGRQVIVPDHIHKIYGTSPPATYMIYAMDPALVCGLNSPLNPSEKKYLDQRMTRLPVIGGWFGQGRVANLETLLQVQPDVILVWTWQQLTVNEKIEQALQPLRIPVVYITIDTLADYPAAFRFLGNLFELPDRSRNLARYSEQTLIQIGRVTTAIPKNSRMSVYYAEGADGLSTECRNSVHAQLIPLSGGDNVHFCNEHNPNGMQRISMEQVLQYDPQVIVFHEPLFRSILTGTPQWRLTRAVNDGRLYQIPTAPFNWFDRPPSFMRLLGLKWLTHHLYPRIYPLNLIAETRLFYRLFLNVELDEATARELLGP